jgi:hypothetical protein
MGWYGNRQGWGIACGRASGNTEALDFDDAETFRLFLERAVEFGILDLIERVSNGCSTRTPGDGIHFLWKCETIGGSTKLAMRPAPTEANPYGQKTLIELKGEGGYVIEAPSGGTVHPTGKPYEQLAGGPDTIATITPDEREAILSLARSFDERPRKEFAAERKRKRKLAEDGTTQPGDDFNARTTWQDILGTLGFVKVFERGETTYWRRPGKSHGISGTTNHGGSDCLFLFSTSTQFEVSVSYTKFGVYALLNHGGDFAAAARQLAEDGYGTHVVEEDEPDDPWIKHKVIKQNPRPRKKPGRPRAEKTRSAGEGLGPNLADAVAAAVGKSDLPEILVSTARHQTLDDSVKVLAGDPGIFRRGDVLVEVMVEAADEVELAGGTILKKMAGAPRIVPIAESVLSCRLTRHARFVTPRPTRDGGMEIVPCHPAQWLTSALIELKNWRGVRPLEAVVSIPIVLPDGTIHQAPGYEPVTRSLYIPTCRVPPIPANPTREDARAAGTRLMALVDQFPFATDNDRAVWLAGLLTAAARPAISGPVPGIAVNGNRAGTGKGLLVDVVGLLVFGKPIPTSSYPDDRDEASKVKVSLAMEGASIVHFDNLDEGSCYGGSAIDSAITSLTVNDRILGTNRRTGEIQLRPCWWLTGNNIAPGKDAFRRWLPLNLITLLERPEERDDLAVRDLRAYVAEHRTELVRDVLIILRAHAAAGRPGGQWAPLGSFEEWDRVIRGAVWYATGWDCGRTRREAADDSPERMKKIALLEGWRELPNGKTERGCTVSEAIAHLKDHPSACQALRNAMVELAPPGKEMDSRRLGDLIRSLQNAVHGGLIIKHAGVFHHAAKWRVESADPTNPDPDGTDTGRNARWESGSQGESQEPRPENSTEMRSNGHAAHANGNKYGSGPRLTPTDSPTPTGTAVHVPDDAEDF